jgi:hypothetical protein
LPSSNPATSSSVGAVPAPPMVRSLIPCLTSEWCDAGRCLGVCGNKPYVTVMLLDLVWRWFTTSSSRL